MKRTGPVKATGPVVLVKSWQSFLNLGIGQPLPRLKWLVVGIHPHTHMEAKRTMPSNYICSGWCCTDCIIMLANGESPVDMTEEAEQAWWEKYVTCSEKYDITPGMLREDHACVTNHTVHTADGKEHDILADDEVDAYLNGPDTGILRVQPHELETDGDRGKDDDCERQDFSWQSCDICGGNLGGERHAVSFFSKTLPTTQSDIRVWSDDKDDFVPVMAATA